MKIWLCSDGSYSDYHITAVYSDEETAKTVTAAYGWENAPEEIELDPEVPQQIRDGYQHWRVYIWADNGDVQYAENAEDAEYATDRWHENTNGWFMSGRKGWYGVVFCWAKDKDHAIKIANERRIAWKVSRDLEQRN
jgi:hypothetical protein